MIYCTLFNPAIDVVYTLDELMIGGTHTNVSAATNFAGKGLNVARVLNALGEDVAVLGLMPENDMEPFKRYCNSLGMGTFFHPVDGHVRINTTFSEKLAGQVTHINASGFTFNSRIQDEFQLFIEQNLSEDDFWIFSGSLPSGFDGDAYAKIVKICNEKQIESMLDTRDIALNRGVRAKPFMVKPNHQELEMFFGERIEGIQHIALKAKRLLDMGVEYAFISLGNDGMIAVHGNDCLLCSTPLIEVIDTVGCGDAMVAGIVAGYKRKFSFTETCRLAVACGTSNAMHMGPGFIDADEIWKLMEDVHIESV